MLILIIVASIVTSSIVSFIWMKWFMHNLYKWMDEFFKEETDFIERNLYASFKERFTKTR